MEEIVISLRAQLPLCIHVYMCVCVRIPKVDKIEADNCSDNLKSETSDVYEIFVIERLRRRAKPKQSNYLYVKGFVRTC